MEQRRFGRTGLQVTPIGLGGYPFGGVNRAAGWDPFTPDGRREAIATIHRAIERGVTYVDTAPGYGAGNSESLFGEALAQDGRRGRVALALRYVLADSRVHVANVGMRWPHEVDQNVDLAAAFRPPQGFDVADLPRKTEGIYRAADAGAAPDAPTPSAAPAPGRR
jgi:aryl-alcohol dehydrogenase-like predicted oxidoreductase